MTKSSSKNVVTQKVVEFISSMLTVTCDMEFDHNIRPRFEYHVVVSFGSTTTRVVNKVNDSV